MIRRALAAVALAGLAAGCSPKPYPIRAFTIETGFGPRDASVTPTVAAPAQAFVDSAGANIHLIYDSAVYGPAAFPLLRRRLRESGIRHVRDGMLFGMATRAAEFRALARDGIRYDAISGAGVPEARVRAWFASLGLGVAESCEGVNEYDISHPPAVTDWAAVDAASQRSTARVCRSLGLRVYGPSMGERLGYAAVGDVGAYADAANMHPYTSWRNPGTSGWHFSAYGSLGANMALAAASVPSGRFVSTEGGYGSIPGDAGYVPAAIKARYLVRMYLDGFGSGIERTYVYEFADEGVRPYSTMGLVDGRLGIEPAFRAVAGMLHMLADPGPPFAAHGLAYTLDGGRPTVRSLELEKRDGTFRLAVWDEREEYDGRRHVPEILPPVPVTLTFARAPGRVVPYTLRDDGTYERGPAVVAPAVLRLAVDGHPVFLEVTGAR